MKLGLFGYGKMGKAIEQIAENQGIEIVWRIRRDDTPTPALLRQADVIIEFTRPEAAFENVMLCLQAGIPVVSGTTGWLERLPEAQQYCLENKGALLWASNFSVGVNLFFALNRRLAQLMADRPEYAASLVETHHIHKLDAPSGTALTLANELIENADRCHLSSLGSFIVVIGVIYRHWGHLSSLGSLGSLGSFIVIGVIGVILTQ
jgi:4-hydroxy-tetrahydrodipicolinate reductase